MFSSQESVLSSVPYILFLLVWNSNVETAWTPVENHWSRLNRFEHLFNYWYVRLIYAWGTSFRWLQTNVAKHIIYLSIYLFTHLLIYWSFISRSASTLNWASPWRSCVVRQQHWHSIIKKMKIDGKIRPYNVYTSIQVQCIDIKSSMKSASRRKS